MPPSPLPAIWKLPWILRFSNVRYEGELWFVPDGLPSVSPPQSLLQVPPRFGTPAPAPTAGVEDVDTGSKVIAGALSGQSL